jgi:hypothetical protein
MVTDAEWKYLLDSLNGNRIYSLHEKFKMTGEICLRVFCKYFLEKVASKNGEK